MDLRQKLSVILVVTASCVYFPGCSGAKSASPSTSSAPGQQSPPGQSSIFGGTVSYSAYGSDNYAHVYVLSVAGVATALTSGPYSDATPEWSFDATKVTFQRSDGSTGYAIYTMNADGSALKRLSPIPGADLLPAWSPDGTKIIFTRVVGQPSSSTHNLPQTSIMIMNADGSDVQTLMASSTASFFNMEPRFSPDGSKIVFTCGMHGSSTSTTGLQVCLMNSDGSNLTYLTDVAAVSGDPHWSHDGTKLVFDSNRGGNINVFVMSADGSGVIQLTNFTEPQEAGDAGWSLDDSHIIFEHDIGGNSESSPTAPATLWLMNADGSNQQDSGIACRDDSCGPRFQP